MVVEPWEIVMFLIACPVIEKIWKQIGSSLFAVKVMAPEDALTEAWLPMVELVAWDGKA